MSAVAPPSLEPCCSSLSVVGPAAGQDEAAPVPYLDAEGTSWAPILIRDFADPFTEFDPAGPPAEGQRYAVLTITFEAAEDQAFPTDPYQVQLLDSERLSPLLELGAAST